MKVFRTDFWRNVSFPEGYWFEDSIISMIVLQQMKRVVRIHDMVYTYRANSSGMTSAARQNRKALDSFWIMVQLIKDHAQLELPETNEYWLQILRQIHITYQRTRWMPDYIKKSIFTLSVGIVDQLFPEEILDGGWKFHALLSTLRQKNYRAYCLICEINDSLDE